MDFVSFVELCAALVTVATPLFSMLYADMQKHIALDAKLETIAATVQTHAQQLETIQADIEGIAQVVKGVSQR